MERWKPIKNYEGFYEISTLGRVKSKRGVRKPFINKYGYPCVSLWKHCVGETKPIHRLVAETFIPNPENKREVNHIDGNKQNNSVENLEWVTPSENKKHAQKLGLAPKPPRHDGENCHAHKLTKEDVTNIRKEYKRNTPGYGAPTLAKKYGVSTRQITNIVNGDEWKWLDT